PSTRAGPEPERDRDGDDKSEHRGPVVPQVLDGAVTQLRVTDDRGRAEECSQRDDLRDVRLVRDLDPVDVVHAPGPPTSLQRAERVAGLGRVQDHSRDTTEGLPVQPSRSMTVALAWPPPSHMVWKPKRPRVVSRSLSIVVISRTPLAPSGCPIAIAPPRGLSLAGSGRNSLAHMSAIAANASLHCSASSSSI